MRRRVAAGIAVGAILLGGCAANPVATPAPVSTPEVTVAVTEYHTMAPVAVTRSGPTVTRSVTATKEVTSVPAECREGFLKALAMLSSDSDIMRQYNNVVKLLIDGEVAGVAAMLGQITDDTNTLTYVDLPEFNRLSSACLEG